MSGSMQTSALVTVAAGAPMRALQRTESLLQLLEPLSAPLSFSERSFSYTTMICTWMISSNQTV